jgi:hypothetical protein
MPFVQVLGTSVNSPARDLEVLPRRPTQAGLTGARALAITRSAAGVKASRLRRAPDRLS